MQKAARDKQLALVFVGQFHCDMAAKCGRAGTDIYRHIQNAPVQYAYQLCLGVFSCLAMQAAYNAVRRLGLVILNKSVGNTGAGKFRLVIAFKKVAARIRKDAGFYDNNCLLYTSDAADEMLGV